MSNYTAIREWADEKTADKTRIVVGLGTCGIAAGGNKILEAVENTLTDNDAIQADVVSVGCIGICYKEPLLDIEIPGQPRLSYGPVTPRETKQILQNVFIDNEYKHKKSLAVIGDNHFEEIPSWKEIPFFRTPGTQGFTQLWFYRSRKNRRLYCQRWLCRSFTRTLRYDACRSD